MSAISGYINQIQNAVYGEQVRTAIVNALLACYSDVENPDLQSAAFQEAIEAAYQGGILDIIEVTQVSQMTNEDIIYRYMGTETGYTANTLYYHNGTAWVPIGSGIQVASSAALMTDNSAIYKYTGSENGYTTNALYYYNGTDWVEVAPQLDATLTQANKAADAKAVGEALIELAASGISSEIKTALLNCFKNVAWANANGAQYYSALQAALNSEPPAPGIVTNGLIHYYDAINNTGNGHDGASTTWADLVGTQDLTMNNASLASWNENSLVLPGTAGQQLVGAEELSNAEGKTIEIVFEPSNTSYTGVIAFYDSLFDATAASNKGLGNIWAYGSNVNAFIGVMAEVHNLYGLSSLENVKAVRSVSASFSSRTEVNKVFINGAEATQGNYQSVRHYSNPTVMTVGSKQDYPMQGKIHAIRIYNRILTSVEMAHNYADDVERYRL